MPDLTTSTLFIENYQYISEYRQQTLQNGAALFSENPKTLYIKNHL
ncbi:MAG: hypothetical protein ACFFA4_05590 [Promethearchaeota archaeon]